MRIIAIKKLREFWEFGHADSEVPLKIWYQLLKNNIFASPAEIKQMFPRCSFIGNNRLVFNISGNKYRLVAFARYDIQIIYIRFVGTHAQYDKINVNEV